MGSGISSVHPKLSSLTHPSTMHRLIGALLFGIIGLSQGTPPATPVSSPPVPPPGLRYRPYRPPPSPFGGMGADPLTLSLLLGGGLGGSGGSTDSLLPLLLLGGGKGGFGGLGGHGGGINPLMLSLLSCKEPVTDCQKPNEGSNLCGEGATKPCCTCSGGLFG